MKSGKGRSDRTSLPLHDLGHIGQLHLDAVLVLVRLAVHQLEFAGGVQLLVDWQRPKRKRTN